MRKTGKGVLLCGLVIFPFPASLLRYAAHSSPLFTRFVLHPRRHPHTPMHNPTHTYTHNAFFHPSCPGKAGIDGARLQHPLRRAAAPIQPPRAHPAVLTFCFSPPEQAAGALNWHRDLGYPGRGVLIRRKASRRVSVLDSRTGTATSCILEKQPGPLLFDDGERKRFWLLCSSPVQGALIS